MKDAPLCALFVRAIALVRSGWTQGVAVRDAHGDPIGADGSRKARQFCVLAALYRASEGNALLYGRAYLTLWHHLRIRYTLPGYTLTGWNDAPERTQADVLRALQACLDHLTDPLAIRVRA